MKNINKLMKGINNISKIEFKLSSERGDIYVSPKFKEDKENCISESFFIENDEVKIIVDKNQGNALPLLEHYIKNSIMEVNRKKDKVILDIIEGREVLKDELLAGYPFLLGKFSILVIYVEEDIEEVFELVQAGYKGVDTALILYKDRIIILGELDDAYEHAVSIKEDLVYDFSGKCVICYSSVNNYSEIKRVLQICNNKIYIALRFNIRDEVIGENDLIFEEIVQSMSNDQKNKFSKEYAEGFSKINADLFNTVEIFFKYGLNISEAANKLFIHRNTLIYRLDKIQKYTGFDVRNFNQATIFKVILLVWKEKNA